MSNVDRGRRHLTTDILCPMCRNSPKDVDHVLRSCANTAVVWCSLINPDKQSEFFSIGIFGRLGMRYLLITRLRVLVLFLHKAGVSGTLRFGLYLRNNVPSLQFSRCNVDRIRGVLQSKGG
ncbi:hypothetical protein V6N13_015555 [Hibiscus sabdariffa]